MSVAKPRLRSQEGHPRRALVRASPKNKTPARACQGRKQLLGKVERFDHSRLHDPWKWRWHHGLTAIAPEKWDDRDQVFSPISMLTQAQNACEIEACN